MPAFVLEVSCLTCPGVIDVVSPDRVRQAAVEHYQQLHPWVPSPAAGTDYVAIDAPTVCDTCLGLIELPYWEHISSPPTHAGGELDRDGIWLDIFSIWHLMLLNCTLACWACPVGRFSCPQLPRSISPVICPSRARSAGRSTTPTDRKCCRTSDSSKAKSWA
jgi:hypothetical protein